MRRAPIVAGAAVLLVCSVPAGAFASGWLQQPGSCYAKLWNRTLIGSRAYTADGDRQDVASYQDHQVTYYAECGIHPWVTPFLSVSPAGYASSGDRSVFYLGPVSVGARVGLLREGRVRAAVSARYGFSPSVGSLVLSRSPIAAEDGSTQLAIYQPALQNHFGELLLEAGIGFKLASLPAFASGSLGARLNSARGVDPVLLATSQLGVTFLRQLIVDLHLSLHEPFFQSVDQTNTAGVGQTRYLGVGLTASWWFLDNLAVFFNFDGVFYAESNAATPSLAFGLEGRLAR